MTKVSNLKLEDDNFIQEVTSIDCTPERQYHKHDNHIIGENNSIFSDQNCYTGKRQKAVAMITATFG